MASLPDISIFILHPILIVIQDEYLLSTQDFRHGLSTELLKYYIQKYHSTKDCLASCWKTFSYFHVSLCHQYISWSRWSQIEFLNQLVIWRISSKNQLSQGIQFNYRSTISTHSIEKYACSTFGIWTLIIKVEFLEI